jgi:predicted permease
MARHGESGMLRELIRNPLILATTGGLAFNLLGLRVPEVLDPSLSRIGAASLALGLMSAGAGMELKALNQGKFLGALVLAVKHLVVPCLAWGLAQLFQLTPLQTTVLLIFSGLPTASTCYVLASRMGYNGAYVAGLVTLSTLLGVLSLPFALGVLGGLKF